jgi:hypothetical protein
MEPVAYGLLALKPLEWEEMLERATVAEIERVVYGARWRTDVLDYRVATQTAHLMNAAGSKPRSADELAMLPPSEFAGWTAEKLLGRPPLELDPAAPTPEGEAASTPPDDGRPDWDEATRREKAERTRLMITMAQAQKATD